MNERASQILGLLGERLEGPDLALVAELVYEIGCAPKTGAQRARECRERKRNERNERNDSVTQRKVSTPSKENPPENTSCFLSPKPKRDDLGMRLPDPWDPPENLWEKGKSEGFSADELRLETRKFRDHFWSLPGPKARKLNWGKAWMNWMRNSRNFTRKPSQGSVLQFKSAPPKRSWAEIKAEREAKRES